MLIGAYLLFAPAVAAQAPSTTLTENLALAHKTQKQAYAREVAKNHGLSQAKQEQFIAVIDWETGGKWDCKMQSDYPNLADGGRELSFGLAQIHLPDHKEVSQTEAQDCIFSLNWMANEWVKGGEQQWTGYRILSARGWK